MSGVRAIPGSPAYGPTGEGGTGLREAPASWWPAETVEPVTIDPAEPSIEVFEPEPAGPPQRTCVRALALTDFRNYRHAAIRPDPRHVVLVGANGAGKTNILEAISLLSPGRGLRRAAYDEIARLGGDGGWAVSARLAEGDEAAPEEATAVGVGLDPPPAGGRSARSRRIRIDGEDAAAEDLLARARIIWLTPAMDGLFTGPSSDRRRFLDRATLAIVPEHGRRSSLYEKAVRHRNRLFEQRRPDAAWLDALEAEIAEHGAAITRARLALVDRLNAAAASREDDDVDFPRAGLRLDGALEASGPADATLADRFRGLLARSRRADQAAGRTLVGPHRSDLVVVHREKAMPAAKASTGEQKALLVGLVLGHAAIIGAVARRAPILLLDEVAAHLDPARRAALYARLDGLNAQCFMTGTDLALFEALETRAQRYRVDAATITPVAPG